jgi:hypothetical protein
MGLESGASGNSSSWIGKVSEFYCIALGDKSLAQQKKQNSACYTNAPHILESGADFNGRSAVYKPPTLPDYNEQRHELQELWLRNCEDAMQFKPNQDARSLLSTALENQLNQLANRHPSRTTWQGLDPAKHSIHVPLRSGISDRASDYSREARFV